ncbi:mitochondrial carrier [Atractiella rhizophila]|nr:mitochondrial carrier [Atractiella rhizophila]
MTTEKRTGNKSLRSLYSGGISGFVSCVLLQPLDLVKTRVQQTHTIASLPTSALKPSLYAVSTNIVRSEGVLAFWNGLTPTILRNVPGVSLYFFSLSSLREAFAQVPLFSLSSTSQPLSTSKKTRPKLTPLGDLLCGSTARTSVGYILMPFTVIKARTESTVAHPPLRSLPAKQIIKTLWRGSAATALRDAPNAGLFVLFYERLRRQLPPSFLSDFTSSATASALSTLLTTPFDLLKTRLQLYPGTYREAFFKVWRERGVRGFYDGAGLRVARKAGSSAVAWAVYEALIKRWN